MSRITSTHSTINWYTHDTFMRTPSLLMAGMYYSSTNEKVASAIIFMYGELMTGAYLGLCSTPVYNKATLYCGTWAHAICSFNLLIVFHLMDIYNMKRYNILIAACGFCFAGIKAFFVMRDWVNNGFDLPYALGIGPIIWSFIGTVIGCCASAMLEIYRK
eukprot:84423_1